IGWFLAAAAEPLSNGGPRFVEQNYGVELFSAADAVFLQPSIAMCNTTQYLMSYTSEKITDFLYVGVLFEPLREITDVSTVDDKICRTLRTIGDNRKYEILKLLAESPRYGQQIASLIDISTATVSHHMSMLIEAGFVDIKRESNRIYYIPNKKKIRDFLDELTEALLG
ncbi:MAG: winged helix-turn-helix transcriptional regulator, partial [Clostridia bacterium]|nr:winged helix-turn-helix transcriptional regulator [Clostridia bacterium]